jgi:hypothetical protein
VVVLHWPPFGCDGCTRPVALVDLFAVCRLLPGRRDAVTATVAALTVGPLLWALRGNDSGLVGHVAAVTATVAGELVWWRVAATGNDLPRVATGVAGRGLLRSSWSTVSGIDHRRCRPLRCRDDARYVAVALPIQSQTRRRRSLQAPTPDLRDDQRRVVRRVVAALRNGDDRPGDPVRSPRTQMSLVRRRGAAGRRNVSGLPIPWLLEARQRPGARCVVIVVDNDGRLAARSMLPLVGRPAGHAVEF